MEKKANGSWIESIIGEWSTMSGKFGNHRYLYCVSDCHTYWAFKIQGSRIVAAAISSGKVHPEMIVGQMVKNVENNGGEWIDGVIDSAESFDLDIFWQAYENT